MLRLNYVHINLLELTLNVPDPILAPACQWATKVLLQISIIHEYMNQIQWHFCRWRHYILNYIPEILHYFH